MENYKFDRMIKKWMSDPTEKILAYSDMFPRITRTEAWKLTMLFVTMFIGKPSYKEFYDRLSIYTAALDAANYKYLRRHDVNINIGAAFDIDAAIAAVECYRRERFGK